jgi:hypothetical protein
MDQSMPHQTSPEQKLPYEKPVIDVMDAEDLLEAFGNVECQSGRLPS